MKIRITVPIIGLLYVFFSWSCAPEKEEDTTKPIHIQPISAHVDLEFLRGQMVYVPAYSQIYSIYCSVGRHAKKEKRIIMYSTVPILLLP